MRPFAVFFADEAAVDGALVSEENRVRMLAAWMRREG